MSERETKEITTPVSQNKIVLKAWITGREKRAISQVYLDGANFDTNNVDKDGALKNASFKGDIVNKAQDATINAIAVSFDGLTEKVLDSILDLRAEDFEFIVAEINKIANPKSEEEVKK